ncbi:MAG: VWA domain-containing protein [Gammaproteobacteria bacterium]|jgi:mxaC protein|nr:VWA domain-containing protein [Gammaproteobacteria bacterium]MBU0771064.1 VWA domain-containing protein [Gammaproteobacteria bacterium]MBU0854645.1 VWA domain-containing protein [Gammaproteobacteria bacterium]MBU1845977.1 VWA domain-containing protein [Gammaproteobacteria bacterium]
MNPFTDIDFTQPWALLLLPLAVLPLLRRRRDTLLFPHLAWLPHDRAGRIAGFAWRALAVLGLLSIVLALAGPGSPETSVTRTGRGAEILILMDRSRSMDAKMKPSDWRTIDPHSLLHQIDSRGEPKSAVARDLLSKFVDQRPDDRFALMFFSAGPMNVVSFTQHDAVVQAGIKAGGLGRGLSDTNVGRGLIAAIESFDQRAYSGSRIIMLVTDGGAHLDEPTRKRIRSGLQANRIALHWLYLRTLNAPELGDEASAGPPDAPGDDPASIEARNAWATQESIPEVSLHRYFQSLPTPYHLYQADSPEDLAKAVAEVGRQQNFPLDFQEQIPRQDHSRLFIALAVLCCTGLLIYRSMLLRSWL